MYPWGRFSWSRRVLDCDGLILANGESMPKRVSLICLGLWLVLGSLSAGGCGNDGEIVVREPTTAAPATRTPVLDE